MVGSSLRKKSKIYRCLNQKTEGDRGDPDYLITN